MRYVKRVSRSKAKVGADALDCAHIGCSGAVCRDLDAGLNGAQSGYQAARQHPGRCLVVNVLLYRALWGLGFTPWERRQAWAEQVSAMFDGEEQGRQPPYGAALDLGCGTGFWSVDLAERGWEVTGVEIVPKALRAARERAQKAGVEVRFLEGSVASLRDADAGFGFRLVLDLGTVHGLAPAEVKAVAGEVNAVTTDDATLLMYAFSPGRKGPTPRGLDREEVEAAYAGWRVVDEQPFDTSGMPALFKKADPRWYRLRRD